MINGIAVPARPDDTEAQRKEAEAYARTKADLEKMAEMARTNNLTTMRFVALRELNDLSKKRRKAASAGSCDDIVRRYLQAERAQEAEVTAKARARNHRLKVRLTKQRLLKARLQNQAEKKKRAAAAAKAAAADRAEQAKKSWAQFSRDFGAGALGQGRKNGGDLEHVNHREQWLERLHVLFPLPAEDEVFWDDFRRWFPMWIGFRQGDKVGSWLVSQVDIIKKNAQPKPGDEKAPKQRNPFGNWMRQQLQSRNVGPKEGGSKCRL